MHNNYYFFKHLSPRLSAELSGSILVNCFSQHKNELILEFAKKEAFYIKAYLDPAFCCLSFPQEFHRARKNSVDLFGLLIGSEVVNVREFAHERSFALNFRNEKTLLFKMHGNRSNIVLFDQERPADQFKKSMVKDQSLDLNALDRNIRQDYEHFKSLDGNLEKLFPTLGKTLKHYLNSKKYLALDVQGKWALLGEIMQQFHSPTYYITRYEDTLVFSLIKLGEVQCSFQDPIEAINYFFLHYLRTYQLDREKKAVLSILNKSVRKHENYILKTRSKLASLHTQVSHEHLGHLIMANLHRITPGLKEVVLENFYRENQPVRIKLKENLSPQKNAEVYYRKAKNQKKEIDKLSDNLHHKEHQILKLKAQIERVSNCQDLKTLKKFYEKESPIPAQNLPALPFYTFHHNDFEIRVGKNAKSNDLLIQQYTFKEDVWLHVKDAQGSHVVIKHRAGKHIPKDTLEKAAQLAAWYSKRKTESLVPVSYTPRKFIRKRKNDPPGMVAVDKEQVMLVPPEKWNGGIVE